MSFDLSLWSNTNGELGKNKIQFSVNVEDWPEGDALVGNFVYKDGKLTSLHVRMMP